MIGVSEELFAFWTGDAPGTPPLAQFFNSLPGGPLKSKLTLRSPTFRPAEDFDALNFYCLYRWIYCRTTFVKVPGWFSGNMWLGLRTHVSITA